MSDLLCVPLRPGWQVGISERRKLCRPGGASPCGAAGRIPLLALRAWMKRSRVEAKPRIGEGGGDEEDVRLVVRTTPSRVASRNLRATEPLPSSAVQRHSTPSVRHEFWIADSTVSAIERAESIAAWFAVKALITVAEPPSLSIETTVTITPAP